MKRLAAVILSIWAGVAGNFTTDAQSITTIFSFTNGLASPEASLTLGPDGNFYGTTYFGGPGNYGAIYKLATDGTVTTLVNFSNTNGANPAAGLTLGPDGNFYGNTAFGGSSGNYGTVFKVTTNGTLTTLVNFDHAIGAYPEVGLTLGPDGNFYGTTEGGGNGGYGTVYRMTTNGTLTTLVNFNDFNGATPYGNLTLGLDGNFYGTTYGDHTRTDEGTVFKVTTNGTLTTLVNFYGANGANPTAGVTLGPDGNFYGTTFSGGSADDGTVFQAMTNGTYTTLITFASVKGINPYSGLTLGPDGKFYGTTQSGGSNGYGTVFKVATDGTLTTLVHFNSTNGAYPIASLTLGPDGNFYGTTQSGGSGGDGTIFRLNLPPEFIAGPTNQTVLIGHSVTFSGQVFGTGPFAYQWYFNGAPVAGETRSSLSLGAAGATDAGNLQLVVTNAYGSVTNQAVSLNVQLQPNIYSLFHRGSDYMVSLGSYPNSTNRLWASTNLALNQWQVIATNITGASGLSYFLDTNTAGIPWKFYRLSSP